MPIRDLLVRTICAEEQSGSIQMTPKNGWVDGIHYVATTQIPRLRVIAASAKYGKRMTANPTLRTLVHQAANVWFEPILLDAAHYTNVGSSDFARPIQKL
jgi:hypothetical protein